MDACVDGIAVVGGKVPPVLQPSVIIGPHFLPNVRMAVVHTSIDNADRYARPHCCIFPYSQAMSAPICCVPPKLAV